MTFSDNLAKEQRRKPKKMEEIGDFGFLKEDAGQVTKPKGHKKTSLADSLTPPTLKDWREEEEEERKVGENVGKETDNNLFGLLSSQENEKKEKEEKDKRMRQAIGPEVEKK